VVRREPPGSGTHAEEIAAASGVSRYHLTRAFAAATGLALMRYVRARRLAEAARKLANDATGILDIAIASGYGSHEAFTRAFRDQFGVTPESCRGQDGSHNLKLTEPIRMDETTLTNLEAPRLESGRTMLIAGIGERYTRTRARASRRSGSASCRTSGRFATRWAAPLTA
jgi:AraC family transcriptional regulator